MLVQFFYSPLFIPVMGSALNLKCALTNRLLCFTSSDNNGQLGRQAGRVIGRQGKPWPGYTGRPGGRVWGRVVEQPRGLARQAARRSLVKAATWPPGSLESKSQANRKPWKKTRF